MITFLPYDRFYSLFGIRFTIWATMAVISLIVFWFAFVNECKKRNILQHAGPIAIHFGFWTFLGFHLYRVIFVLKDIRMILDLNSGLDSFGVVFGLIAVIVYAYYYRIKIGVLFDSLALPALLAATTQRISDMLINDKKGVTGDLPWSVFHYDALRHPIGMYYFIISLIIVILLCYLARKKLRSGTMFLSAGLLYCSTRFLLDFYRASPLHEYGIFSVHQIAYGSMFIFLLIIFLFRFDVHKYLRYAVLHRSAFLVSLLIGGKKGRWFFKSYQYFRWLDDIIDASPLAEQKKKKILDEQSLLAKKIFRDITSVDYFSLTYEEKCLYNVVLPYYSQKLHSRRLSLEKNFYLLFDTFYYDLERRNKPIIEKEYIQYSKAIGTSYAFAFFESYDISEHEKKYNPYLQKNYRLTVREAVYEYAHLCHMIHTLRDFEMDWKEGYHNQPNGITKHEYFKKIKAYIEPTFEKYSLVINQVQPLPLRMICNHFHRRFKRALNAVKV